MSVCLGVEAGLWKKVMWSDECRFTLFQSDGCTGVKGEVDKVMHLPTAQAGGGGAMIWS